MDLKEKLNLPDLKNKKAEKILLDGLSAVINDCGIEYVWKYISELESADIQKE